MRTRRALSGLMEDQRKQPYLGNLVADYPRRKGGMLSAALCLLALRIYGGPAERGFLVAAGIELLRNGVQIYEDLIDDNPVRRGAPSLHRLCGEPLAINSGDALTLLSLRPLIADWRSLGSTAVLRVLDELNRWVEEEAKGWIRELGWRRQGVVAPGEKAYFDVTLSRFAWPRVIGPLRIGALMSRQPLETPGFVRFGFFWAMALKIREELTVLEAARRGDTSALPNVGRRTLALQRLVARTAPREQRRLREALGPQPGSLETHTAAWILERMDAHDCVRSASKTAREFALAAAHEAENMAVGLPRAGDPGLLLDLAIWDGKAA